jgi:uncharacterized membrane protein YdbT with pleckstrin-like domain
VLGLKLKKKQIKRARKNISPSGQKIHHPKGHVLSAFRLHPERANFVNKDPEERVILLLRRHPVTNIGWIIISILMLIAPYFFKIFSSDFFLPDRYQFVSLIGWYLVTTAFVFEKFLSWFFNVNIVTDERIFDVNFVNLVYREMTDANIDLIQDVSVRMGSVVRTIFNYGDVFIQTASEVPRIIFEAVPNPDGVAKVLRELRVEEEVERMEGRVR